MGQYSAAAIAKFDRALAAHSQHLSFLHDNFSMLGLEGVIFTAAEGRLYENSCQKGSPDLLAVKAGDPLEWYTIELKNGQGKSKTIKKGIDSQVKRAKSILLRRGVYAHTVKIYRLKEERFAVFVDDTQYAEYNSPVSESGLERVCDQITPAQKFLISHPQSLGIDSVLFSAVNGRIMKGEGYASADIVFVEAKNPASWHLVAIKKEEDTANIDDKLSRMRRLLREKGVYAKRIAVRPTISGYNISIEGTPNYFVREPTRYRLQRTA